MSEPTSVVEVEDKEECNKSAGSTDSGRSQEAAVNKKEGRYKAGWAEREDENEAWKNWRHEDEDKRRRLYKYKILCRKLEREKINKTKAGAESRTKPKRWRIILTAEPANWIYIDYWTLW